MPAWLTQKHPVPDSLQGLVRQSYKLPFNSKAFILQLACLLLTLAPPTLPCPTPCQHLPGLLPHPLTPTAAALAAPGPGCSLRAA